MFFSNNLLLALTSNEAVIKNLKSAFGSIVVPISLPSKIQPPNFFLFEFLKSFCLLFKIFLSLGTFIVTMNVLQKIVKLTELMLMILITYIK